MPAKVSGPGEEGQERLQDSAGRHGIPPDGDYQPGSQLPEEPRGAECGGGRQQSTADGLCWVGGVGGVEGEGTAAKPGGRGAGGAEWEGRSWARIRSGRSTWLLPSHWAHFGTWCSCPQTLREQMPGSLFPEGVGWGEAADSSLMGMGVGGGLERVLVSSEGRAGAVHGRHGSHT